MKHFLLSLIILLSVAGNSADIDLPSMGDATSGVISQQQEYELGRAWLRFYRNRLPLLNDPQLQNYLEQLTYRLATHSELRDRRLELILINNPTINAFAVPGGVMGVHTGLFKYAENEHQFAAVMAHEIAHLSQRHFARQIDNQRKNSIVTIAGLLASIALAATVGGDAASAGLFATQAAALQNSLRYSRQNEQEADRFGMQTIYAAGMDPAGVPQMFEEMLQATRYTGHRPPEFLLTHPLTEKRVADAKNRLAKYPQKYYADPLNYHLMRSRAILSLESNPGLAANRFADELRGHSLSKDAARYGLALAQLKQGLLAEARETLHPLLKEAPDNLHYLLAELEIDRAAGQLDKTIQKHHTLLARHPNYYPLQLSLSETYIKANRFYEAEQLLEDLSHSRAEDPHIWFQLAEVRGLAGNISGVHRARAEYFILTGVFDKARDQLGYARKLVSSDFKQTAIIDQRLRDLAELEEKTKNL